MSEGAAAGHPAAYGGLPLWLDRSGRPLAVRLHLPESGPVRGAVVLCPPIGYEWALSHRTLLRLAQQLAAAGFAALRLDYDGVGESWGDDRDPERLAAWTASITTAADALRSWGAADVSLVGLRIGATLAARAADDAGAGALVLWDPPDSGRSFVRLLRATARLQHRRAWPDSITVDGMAVADDTLAELGAADIRVDGDRPVLALIRAGHDGPTLPASVEVRHVEGQEQLFADDTLAAQVPAATLDAIVGWLAERAPAEASTRLEVTAGPSTTYEGVRETFVSVGGFAGVRTEPADSGDDGRQTVVLVPTLVDPHVGPSRTWTGWARQLAWRGITSIRTDLAGIGDSPPAPDGADQRPYGAHLLGDIRTVVAAADTGTGVALTGLCSGARNAVDSGVDEHVRTLIMINPVLRQSRAELEALEVLESGLIEPSLARRWGTRLLGGAPAFWRVAGDLGLLDRGTRRLQETLRAGTDVLLVYSGGDYEGIRAAHEARWRRLARFGRFRVAAVDADHALFDPVGRQEALDVMTAHLLAQRSGAGAATDPAQRDQPVTSAP